MILHYEITMDDLTVSISKYNIYIYTFIHNTHIYIYTHTRFPVYMYICIHKIFFNTITFVYQGIHAHGYPTMGFCLRKRCSFINDVPSEHDDFPPSDAR